MKQSGYLGWLIMAGLLVISTGTAFTAMEMPEVQVKVAKMDSVVHVLREMRLEARHVDEGWIYLDITRNDADRMKKAGLNPVVVIEDLEAVRKQEIENSRDYHTYDSLRTEMLALETAYPTLAMFQVYGQSVQGRDIMSMKISDNVTVDEPEPELRWDGNIHGDEKTTVEVAIYLINELLSNYGTDPQITAIVDNREIWFTPMVNPDGNTAHTRYNANGVDMNRDYGNQWAADGGSTAPYSQPETRAMLELITDHQFTIGVSGHGGTELFIYAWSYTEDPTYDAPQYEHVQQTFESMTSYTGGQSAIVLYQVNGSSKEADYATGAGQGITHEMSYEKTPPYSQIAGYCTRNRPGALWIFEELGTGIHGMVTDSQTGQPVTAHIEVVENGWPIFNDPVVGDYHRYILPGTYSLKVWAQDHETVVIPGVVVPERGDVTVNVSLEPDVFAYAYRVIICRDTQTNDNNHSYTGDSLGPVDGDWYSLGVNAYVIYDMSETHPIIDWPGNDFTVVEGDDGVANEGYEIFVSDSWQGPWTSLGTGAGTTEFDLETSSMETARYLKIQDDGDGSAGAAFPGFDLDAIVVNHTIPGCGVVRLERDRFACSDTVAIEVVDADLNINPAAADTAVVTVFSDTDPVGEDCLVTETGPDTGIFNGSQGLGTSGAEVVLVSHDDLLTIAYDDADCQGAPQTVEMFGTIDCIGPAISNVIVSNASENSLTITWTTDEPAGSVVHYGETVPPTQEIELEALVTTHTVVITGLSDCTTYRFEVGSGDEAGNVSWDSNGGMYYSGTTLELFMMLEATMDTDPGWTYQGQWAWGVPQGNSGDPSSGYTGDHVVGYNLAGSYTNSLPATYCTTTAFDCSDAAQVYFSFYKWLGVESSSWDHASIDVSNNGGSSWTTIWTHTGGSTAPSTWTYEEYDLSSQLAGNSNCMIRWSMGPTDTSVVYCGWNIDDVEVKYTAECVQECINNGDVNFDGVATAGDAQMAFQIALGSISPTPEQFCAADCNADEAVTAGDAQSIFLLALGSGACADPI
ncbi:succinylglutamate desuccinylase/aspartoacylase family protein [bacterium]|nr:succinylglutamate desuccinylase/aspartoacylase family protein [candidate division CSSED10-310 bacterium]